MHLCVAIGFAIDLERAHCALPVASDLMDSTKLEEIIEQQKQHNATLLMSSITVIKNTPVTGAVNSTVMVEWKFGYDVPWEPTTNDELRLLTTSGVLVSRVSLRDAHQRPYPHGSVRYGSPTVSHPGSFAGGSLPPPATTTGDRSPTLWGSWSSVGTPQRQDLHLSAPLSLREACCTVPTAPFGGSFVIAFIDCNNNFKRVYTVPYRIVGPEYLPSITLHLHPHPSHLATEQERQREEKPSSLSSHRLSARAQAPSSSRSLMKESIDKSTILIGKNTNINDTTDDASMRLSARASIANNNNNNNSLKASMKGAEGSLEFSAAAATPSREEVHPHERLTVRFDAGVILDVLNTLPTLTNGHHQTSALGTDGGGDSSSSSVHPLRGGGKYQPLSSSDIALRLASTSSFRFIVCKAQLGDNLGFSAFGVGIFDHCASVSRVPAQAFEAILEREQRSSHHHTDGPLYHTVSLMAPSEEGEYEIRLAVIPAATGLPYSIARSMSFRVLPPQPMAARGRLFGSLTLSKDKCMAGEPLTLSYEVLSGDTHLLSRLDSVGFLPYGRPEAFAHPDAMYNSIMEEVGNKTLSVRAPTEPGVFEGAVFSFLEQQPVMLPSSPLVVLPPKLVVELFEPFVLEHGLQSRSNLHGKAVWGVEGFTAVFQVLVPACLCHPRDRLVIVDEGSNVVHQARVPLDVSTEVSAPDNLYDPAEYQGCFTNMKKTTVEIRHPIPGKYSVHYYSFNNGRFIYQAPLYLDFLSTSRHHSPIPHLPTGAISVLNTLPDDAPIEVMFKKEGADARPASMQKMDCVCLYLHGTPDVSCAPFLDATSAAPYLAVFYLRGSPSETFFLPSLDAIRRAVRNTMHSLTNGEDDNNNGGDDHYHANTTHGGGHGGAAATNGTPGYGVGAGSGSSTSPLRGSISGSRQQARMITRGDVARNSIRKATANPVLSWFFTPELLETLLSATKFSVRYMASVDGHHQRLCLSEAFVSIVARSEVPTTFRAVPLRQVAVRELAMISHRHTSAMTDGSISAVVTPVAMGRRGATGSPSASMMSRSMFSAAKGALRFLRDQDHDFRGAILAPRSCDAVDSIVVTFHITEGMPRVEDQLLLFSVGGTTPIVSCLVSLATDARPDLSLGTLLLKSPMLEGSYVVGYFSTKYNGVVLTSEPVRVIASAEVVANHVVGSKHAKKSQDGGVRRPPRVIGGGGGSVGEAQHLLSSTLSPSANIALLPPPAQVRLPRCKVLLVGVSYFQQPHELKGPLNDVEAMSNIARKYFVREDVNCRYANGGGGSAESSSSNTTTTNSSSNTIDHLIRVLQESTADVSRKPTADNIIQGLAWLVEDAMAGDQLLFYFSGAGSVLPDGSRALLPVDFDWQLRVITPQIIIDRFLLQVPSTVATTVLLDCCHHTTRMEAFRRCELKLLSAGEEELHAGWGGLQRRRKYQGVGVAPWRCIPPSKGTHEENVGASIEEPHSHFAPLLMDASTLCSASNLTLRGMLPSSSPLESRHHDSPPPTSPTTNNNNSLASRPLAVVYEACRSAHAWGDGAWDVFVRDAGVTRGLFTHNLCTIIEGEMMGGDSPGGGHTTGRREAGTTSNNKLQPPPPSLRGGVPLLWFELHERMLRSIEETSYRQAPRLWVGSGDALTAPVALNSLRYGIDEEHSP